MDLFIRWLQIQLAAHGFPPGPIDGFDGPLTRKGIRALQAAKGLTVTGTATKKTIDALREDPNAGDEAMPSRDVDPPESPPPEAVPVWPRQAEVPAVFGSVGENQVRIEVPFDMVLAWDTDTRLTRMTVHRKVAASATRALQRVAETYSPAERTDLGLHLFGGSLAVRRMRGGSRWSMHSWGIAIDFDPLRNAMGWKAPRPRLSQPDAVPFWEAWEAEGWTSLGRARDFDWMHVQAARL